MNIYEKLAHARVDLQAMNLRKSGHNSFAKYDYFELRDFLPAINTLMVKYNMLGVCSFFEECATLTIYDAENPEDAIYFHSPFGRAELPNCHEVQNLGAAETYTRRYLWTAAFEIVEGDALDSTQGSDEDPLGTGNTDKQLKARSGACFSCGAVLTSAQMTLARKYADKHDGKILCADCRAKEDKDA